jgi:hypothetical protein
MPYPSPSATLVYFLPKPSYIVLRSSISSIHDGVAIAILPYSFKGLGDDEVTRPTSWRRAIITIKWASSSVGLCCPKSHWPELESSKSLALAPTSHKNSPSVGTLYRECLVIHIRYQFSTSPVQHIDTRDRLTLSMPASWYTRAMHCQHGLDPRGKR